MVYDSNVNIYIDEESLIEYINRKKLLDDTSLITSAEVHGMIIPFDTVTTYVIRVSYENVNHGVLVEGFMDIKVSKFNKFMRRKKINKIISSVQISF